ncbi:DUF885 family protein [Mycoplasmopsis adleri]|uniref:DUF885 family protein n=1 Tax=Mycoplasmopsis adleri TaxID=51362 RepID=UPI0038734291
MKYNLEVEKGNYTSNVRYLLPSYTWGPASSYIANSFYESILIESAEVLKQTEVAQRWLETLKEAVLKGIVPSKIFIKTNINLILGTMYETELKTFLEDTTTQEVTIDEFFTKYVSRQAENTKEKAFDEFYKYYCTTYYESSKYGLGENIEKIKLYKANTTKDKERILYVNKKPIYGVGLTEKDLTQENAGLGYIPTVGPEIYQQVLKMATSSNWSAQNVYDKGYDSTKANVDNTVAAAERIAEIIVGDATSEWKETIKYDKDGVGPETPTEVEIVIRDNTGKINRENFFKWLNDEAFFFGREDKTIYSPEFMDWLNKQPGAKEGKAELTKFGYDFLIDPANKDKMYGSITDQQFYDGALSAFVAYYQFKNSTVPFGNSFFEYPAPNFEIQTYKYEDRDKVGVGAYESKVQKFMFNADPYYSLQKWSVTSFANHESVMGHHNQIYYAIDHKAKVEGVELHDNFDYTSYTEGWALFMEWFGIEAGYYGTPDYQNSNLHAMPTNFKFAKGITNFYTEEESKQATVSANDIAAIKMLHNGVYWNKVNKFNKYTDESARAKAAIELCNILQFIGALNEAQLRNMRLSIDTAYNGGNVTGREGLKGGASIMQAREYMKANSALGLGDISSESIRYFTCVGQATSYNSGKEIFMDIYKSVYKNNKKVEKNLLKKTTMKTPKNYLTLC